MKIARLGQDIYIRLQIYPNPNYKENFLNIILLIQIAKLMNQSAKAAMKFIKDTTSHVLGIVMEFISPYM